MLLAQAEKADPVTARVLPYWFYSNVARDCSHSEKQVEPSIARLHHLQLLINAAYRYLILDGSCAACTSRKS